jgi:glycosyltransferase involved in cell wall biosynthesis
MNKDGKTLIILTPGFAKDENDSACLPFLQNFVLELNRLYPLLKIVILAFDYPFTKTEYRWHKNDVIPFNGWRKGNIRRVFKWLSVWLKLQKIAKKSSPAGILSLWCTECAYIGNRFARRYQLFHYCWIQGQDAKKENKYVHRIKPSISELIALSDFTRREFEQNHGLRPQNVIPVGILPAEQATENGIRDIDILGVGSLIPLKQYDLFIEVVSEIKRYFPVIKVVLCGKGPEKNKLNVLIAKSGLQDNITLTGELDHKEILGIMSRAKLFLHTSNYEGLGVVCLEALFAGCHVISFVHPMDYEIKHWHVVQTKEEMATKLLSLFKNDGTVYDAVLTFTMEETVKKIMQLFHYQESMSS